MRVIKPYDFRSGIVLSSNIPENDAPVWSQKAYQSNETVIRPNTHRIYTSLDVVPADAGPPENEPLLWSDVGPTNSFAMFDSEVNTQTDTGGLIEVTLLASNADTLALLNIAGDDIEVTVRQGPGGPIVYTYTQSLIGVPIADWLQYLTAPQQQITEVILQDLPITPDGRITIRLTSGGRVAVGQVIVGQQQFIGGTQNGVNIGIIDYSRKDTDEFGVTRFVKRRFSKRMSCTLYIDNSQLNTVAQTLFELRATPTLWITADEDQFKPLVVYGFYRDFNIEVPYATISYCSLEIEGLT